MDHYDYKTQRIYVVDDLLNEGEVQVQRSQANYLLNVLRMKDGAQVLLFNGRHGEWLGEIARAGRKSCTIRLLSNTRAQPQPYDLVLLFAPLKTGRLDYMVQKAVEMGAGKLQPVISDHTQNSKINLKRLRANIIEAAEQCGILTVASIHEPVKLDALLEDWDESRTIIYCDEMAEHNAQVGEAVKKLTRLSKSKLAVLIGPEGGFSKTERNRLNQMNCVTAISLGPRILRADTAAVAAMAIIQVHAGDWQVQK